MKKLLLFPLLLLCTLGVAQEFAWVKSTGYYGNDKGMRCAEDAQGNLLFAGSFADSILFAPGTRLRSIGRTDFYLLKTDAQGEALWAVNGGGASSTAEATGVDVDADNNIYVGGFFKDSLTVGSIKVYGHSDSQNDCFIAKFNANGELQWLKAFVGPQGDQLEDLNVAGSTIYATGRYKGTLSINGVEFSSGATSPGDNPFVVALNLDGSTRWINKVDCSSGFARCVEADATGKVNVAFELKYDGGSSPVLRTVGTPYFKALRASTGTTDDYLVRLSSETGEVVWGNRISSANHEMCYALTSDLQGNVYIGGIFQSTVTLESTAVGTSASGTSAGSFDIFIGKYDAGGKLSWHTFLGTPKSDNMLDLAVDQQGYLHVAGYTMSDAITVGTFTLTAPDAKQNAIMVRYTPAGEVAWATMATSTNGSFWIGSLETTSNNSMVLNGYYKGKGTFFNSAELPNSAIVAADTSTSNIVYARLSNPTAWTPYANANGIEVSLHPNPVSGALHFSVPDNVTVYDVQVLGLAGQELLREKPRNGSVDVSGLETGIYLVRFTTSLGVVAKKAVVLK